MWLRVNCRIASICSSLQTEDGRCVRSKSDTPRIVASRILSKVQSLVESLPSQSTMELGYVATFSSYCGGALTRATPLGPGDCTAAPGPISAQDFLEFSTFGACYTPNFLLSALKHGAAIIQHRGRLTGQSLGTCMIVVQAFCPTRSQDCKLYLPFWFQNVSSRQHSGCRRKPAQFVHPLSLLVVDV